MVPKLSELRQLQQDVIDSSQILSKEFGVQIGHPSQRIPGTDRFIIMGHLHPQGKGMGGVRSREELVVLDTGLRKISGRWEKMNEAMVHAAIYRARPDVNGVTYVHPFFADLFAAVNRPVPTYQDSIPIWDSKGAIADPGRGEGLVKALGDKDAILLRNPHSLVTCADSVRDATVMATMIEQNARRDYHALTLVGEEYRSVIKDDPKRPPRFPWKDFVYHVDDFDMDVMHFDLWKQLYERHVAPPQEG